MAKQMREGYTSFVRCFLSIPLPEHITDELSRSFERTETPQNIHRIDEQFWHITLAFLFEVDEDNLHSIIKACERFQKSPGSLTINEFITFPERDAHLIVGVADETSSAPWKVFVQNLREAIYPYAKEIDQKPWIPHITIAKATEDTCLKKWKKILEPLSWTPKNFELVQSKPAPDGPHYRTIRVFPFSANHSSRSGR